MGRLVDTIVSYRETIGRCFESREALMVTLKRLRGSRALLAAVTFHGGVAADEVGGAAAVPADFRFAAGAGRSLERDRAAHPVARDAGEVSVREARRIV